MRRRYGARWVFRDSETIEGGEDWQSKIRESLERSAVLVVLIAEAWAVDPDDDDDWVAYELRTAAKLGIRVIPVLVERKKLPSKAELGPFAWLHRGQSVSIVGGQEEAGIGKLLKATDASVGMIARRRNRWMASLLLLAGLTSAGYRYVDRPDLPRFADLEETLVVSPFTIRDDNSSNTRLTDASRAHTTHVVAELDLDAGVQVEQLHHADHSLMGETDTERLREARQLLDRTNADVLVSGTIFRDDASGSWKTTVGIVLGDILAVPELMGEQIELDSSPIFGVKSDLNAPGASEDLAVQVAMHLGPLGLLLDMANAFERRQFAATDELATELIDGDLLADERSVMAIRHLRGNARSSLGRFDEAQADFDLGARAGFERSALGLAGVLYTEATNATCVRPDTGKLSDAFQQFADVLRDTDDDIIGAKARLGLAQVTHCEAIYHRNNERIRRDRIVFSLRELDLSIEGLEDPTTRTADLDEPLAVAHFTKALILTTTEDTDLIGTDPHREAYELLGLAAAGTSRPWFASKAVRERIRLVETHPLLGDNDSLLSALCDLTRQTLDLVAEGEERLRAVEDARVLDAEGMQCGPLDTG